MVMALTRFLFTTSLLLLPLLILASAADYSHSANPEGDKSNSQDYNYSPNQDVDKSKSQDKSKNEGCSYSSKSYVDKSKQEDHGYTQELDVEKSKSKKKSKQGDYGYVSNSDKVEHYKRKVVDHDYTENGYNSKSYIDKSNNDYSFESDGNGYNRKVDIYQSKSKSIEYNGYDSNSDYDKSKLVEKEKSMSISIEGLLYCKSGSSYYPLQGAVAKVTCVSVDEHGYETTPLTVYSDATDDKGYFYASFSPSELTYGSHKLTECKAYLERSPVEDCNVPTDVNNGFTGASLTSYRILKDKNTKLYSMKTFYFTSADSESKSSAPTGY